MALEWKERRKQSNLVSLGRGLWNQVQAPRAGKQSGHPYLLLYLGIKLAFLGSIWHCSTLKAHQTTDLSLC